MQLESQKSQSEQSITEILSESASLVSVSDSNLEHISSLNIESADDDTLDYANLFEDHHKNQEDVTIFKSLLQHHHLGSLWWVRDLFNS